MKYQVVGNDGGMESYGDTGMLMACQLHHAADEAFEVEQGRFGSARKPAVGFYESEQPFACGTDCLQTVPHLFFRYPGSGQFQQGVAQGSDGGYGVHDFMGQHACKAYPRVYLLFVQFVVDVVQGEHGVWVRKNL